jgi:ketosteroid isomerase-like protein
MSASNRLMVVLMALVFTASFSAAAAPTQIEEEVLATDLQRFDAMTKGDAAKLETLLAAEAIYVNSDARIDDRQSIFYGVKTKSTTYHSIIATERKARVTGEIALLTGVAAIRGVERKENVDLTVRYVAVYMKRDGRWQMTAGQATQLVPTNNIISGQPA